MIDEETIKEMNKWFDDEERSYDTNHIDGQYSICSYDIDDFCDFLTEHEPDLIGIPCQLCAEGIWFTDEDLENARHY